jgi:hypothetical protein
VPKIPPLADFNAPNDRAHIANASPFGPIDREPSVLDALLSKYRKPKYRSGRSIPNDPVPMRSRLAVKVATQSEPAEAVRQS